ncbi:MAG: hypothetical protein KGJ01_00255 [Patescibacteria group bacterium]|nr:hypothetical protein [Patescibacteria group bacterium]
MTDEEVAGRHCIHDDGEGRGMTNDRFFAQNDERKTTPQNDERKTTPQNDELVFTNAL